MARYSDTTFKLRKSHIHLLLLVMVAFPFIASNYGNSWVRMMDIALLYVMMALGLNIVVGFAGLLDLGYIAFYALGAYMAGLLASPQFAVVLESIVNHYPDAGNAPFEYPVIAGQGWEGGFQTAIVQMPPAEPLRAEPVEERPWRQYKDRT